MWKYHAKTLEKCGKYHVLIRNRCQIGVNLALKQVAVEDGALRQIRDLPLGVVLRGHCVVTLLVQEGELGVETLALHLLHTCKRPVSLLFF